MTSPTDPTPAPAAPIERSGANRSLSLITITVLPHPDACPDGAVIDDVAPGTSICRALLDHGVEIEHACELSCACTTCHVIVRQGFDSLAESSEDEDDLLDMAWGLTPLSRLSCQAPVGTEDLVVEIPKYSINHAKEGSR